MVTLVPKDSTVTEINYFALTLSGLMERGYKKIYLLHNSLIHISAFFTIISVGAELFLGEKDTESIVEALSQLVVCILGAIKSFLFSFKRKEIMKLFDRLENIRVKTLKDEENKHFFNYADLRGRKMYPVLFVALPCYPISSFLLNSISEIMSGFSTKHLIYKFYIPWSTEEIWIHVLTNIIETIATFLYVCVYHAFYSVEITFTLYTTAYIKSLQNDLKNKVINKQQYFEHHKDINQLINDYTEIWSFLMYVQTVIAPIMPCGNIVSSLRALQRDDTSKSFENIIRGILCLLPCIVTCVSGQVIITQMERLHEAAYMNNWYEQKPRVRKDLLKLMTRTTTTASVNYRLFIRFDHDLLSKVLQVIYSYTMLMVNFA
ncbi:hypothetical protein O3M35_008456 [Rhynocoris fuscipes]|uniref:Odorant receptor n=1 Tax=Rhynocoris fuscipes TaxID=488301 RepID=A0AAW1D705_9HEMI